MTKTMTAQWTEIDAERIASRNGISVRQAKGIIRNVRTEGRVDHVRKQAEKWRVRREANRTALGQGAMTEALDQCKAQIQARLKQLNK